MATSTETKETVNRITTERTVLQIFGSGLSAADVAGVLAKAEVKEIKPGEAIIKEGEESYDIYIVLRGLRWWWSARSPARRCSSPTSRPASGPR